MSEQRRGLVFGVSAYLLWGLFPLYWGLLEPSGPLEILAHRIVWSLVFVLGVLAVLRRWTWLRSLPSRRRSLGLLVVAAVLLGANWYVYIYGVNSGQVVETSLGYFINPLVAILLGVVVLRERLRTTQWTALGLGALAVAVLAVDYGRLPWIAIVLAFSFGTYGLLKKVVGAPAVEGLAVESAALVLPAVAYLVWLTASGDAAFGHVSVGHTLLMVGAGVTTAIPLLFFAGAANRVPLSTLGVLQYLAPVLQFLIGVFVFAEDMPAARWAGFGLVWVALAVFTVDGVRHHRRESAAARSALATASA